MLIANIDLKKVRLSQLKTIARILRIKNFSKFRKVDLFHVISRWTAAIVIQKNFRNTIVNNPCPLTLYPVTFPCYAFKPKGCSGLVHYNLEPLIQFLLVSGDFRDPKTRQHYSMTNLKELDTLSKTNKLGTKSVFQASKKTLYYRRIREREEEILVLERCLDEVVGIMLTLIESDSEALETIQVRLNTFHFPTFHTYFRRLHSRDRQTSQYYAEHCLGHIRSTCSGCNISVLDSVISFVVQMKEIYPS